MAAATAAEQSRAEQAARKASENGQRSTRGATEVLLKLWVQSQSVGGGGLPTASGEMQRV